MKVVQLGDLEESVAYQEIKEEGRCAMLTKLLTQKFGALPEWALSRLQSGRNGALNEWSDKFLTAKTLEQVFDSPGESE